MKFIIFIVSLPILFFIICEPIECKAVITSSEYTLSKRQHIIVKANTISYCNNLHVETIYSHTDEDIKNYIKSNPTKQLFKIRDSITNLHFLILTLIILGLFALYDYCYPKYEYAPKYENSRYMICGRYVIRD